MKVWSATYLPFGGVHVSTGTLPANRFPGQWFQSESGLHQNWMRDYDPTTGRYLQADPLGLVDGASVYGYAVQSPMMYTDPTGECAGPLAYVCAAAGGAAWGIGVGFVLDMTFGDGCYTWDELKRDALWGAAGGVAFKAAGAAWRAFRGAPAAAASATRSGAMAAAGAAAARGNSKALAKALAAAGASRGFQEAAHHIVAGAARAAAPAREALKRAGVGIDEAANGMFLPQSFHRSMHTKKYYDTVNTALENVSTRGEALDVLSDLAQWIGGRVGN